MSWANIRIPRKRDLSQIPEDFRPQLVPRVERSEVVNSEAYQIQDRLQLEKSDKSDKSDKSEKPQTKVDIRQHVVKKIDTSLKVSAYELKYNRKSYVFVILRNIRTIRDNDLWIHSYNSIRKFYTNKIVIIDDNSSINTVDGKLLNTEIIKSKFSGAGEILPYYYFLKNKWADRMIFIHDSMSINRLFRDKELEDTKFHWHFNNTGDNRKILYYISMLQNNKTLYEYADNPESDWKGCFGSASIIDLDVVIKLEEKYNVFTILPLSIKTRSDREAFERIFGIIMYHEGIAIESNFGDIEKYPNAFELYNVDNAAYTVGQKGYDTAIIKVWRGR